MEYVEKVISIVVEYGPIAATVLAALIGFLAVVAPLTKTNKDNWVLDKLRLLEKGLAWLLVKVTPKSAALALSKQVEAERITDAMKKAGLLKK